MVRGCCCSAWAVMGVCWLRRCQRVLAALVESCCPMMARMRFCRGSGADF